MRCRACDRNLNDYESTRKSIVTGEYYDLCNACFRHIKDEAVALSRPDLEDVIDEVELKQDVVDSYEDLGYSDSNSDLIDSFKSYSQDDY